MSLHLYRNHGVGEFAQEQGTADVEVSAKLDRDAKEAAAAKSLRGVHAEVDEAKAMLRENAEKLGEMQVPQIDLSAHSAPSHE